MPGPIRSHHKETVADRLLRLRRWSLTGLAAAAELELHAWQRESRCPPAAALMLAKFAAYRGETEVAYDRLAAFEQQHHSGDSRIVQMLICLSWQLDRHDEAAAWLDELQEHSAHLPTIQRWMRTMDENQLPGQTPHVDHTIEQLAVELMDHLSVLPTLIVALKLDTDAETVVTLRAGLNHAFRDIHGQHEQILACEALAELALLAGDMRDARRWAHRGRKLDPYHVRFALILAQVQDDAAVGPPATFALSEALRVYPHYPDVRAALIRREFADGQTSVARRRLRVWLNDQPEHPLALTLEQELAA